MEGGETGYYFGNYGTGSFNWLITIYRGPDPGLGIERTNERTNVAHHCTISIRVLPLSCIPRCQPDRATIVPHGSFFPRMKLILRDVGARTSTRYLRPRRFFRLYAAPLPLSLSLYLSVISKGYKKWP